MSKNQKTTLLNASFSLQLQEEDTRFQGDPFFIVLNLVKDGQLFVSDIEIVKPVLPDKEVGNLINLDILKELRNKKNSIFHSILAPSKKRELGIEELSNESI